MSSSLLNHKETKTGMGTVPEKNEENIVQHTAVYLVDEDDIFFSKLKQCEYLQYSSFDLERITKEEAADINPKEAEFFVVIDKNSKSGIMEIINLLDKDKQKILISDRSYSAEEMLRLNSSGVKLFFNIATPMNFIAGAVLSWHSDISKENEIALNERFIETESLDFSIKTKDIVFLNFVPYLYKLIKKYTDDYVKIVMVFNEVLTNAVEHGNLELKSHWKTSDLTSSTDKFSEEYEKRLKEPTFSERNVGISIKLNKQMCSFSVKDEGRGYDYRKFIKSKDTGENPYGRGLKMITALSDQVIFKNNGREVVVFFNF